MSKGKVLLVDDEKDVRFVLKTALKKAGYQLEEGVNGEDGLEKLASFNPHIIILDLMMPKMDGFTFNYKLKENPKWKDIPVIIITGKGDMKEFLEARKDVNVAGYLEKPFRVKTLIERIEEALL